MLRAESIVQRVDAHGRPSGDVSDQGHGGGGRSDDVDATVEVQDDVVGPSLAHDDLDAIHAAERDGRLLDVRSDRYLPHEFVERGAQPEDVAARVESSLAQDRIQTQLLLLAHATTMASMQCALPQGTDIE